MTYQYADSSASDVSKMTISTWVYIPKASVQATITAKNAAKANHQDPVAMGRLPIIEFGKNADPHIAILSGMSFQWEGSLGEFEAFGSAPGGPGVPTTPPPKQRGNIAVKIDGDWKASCASTHGIINGGTGSSGIIGITHASGHPSPDPVGVLFGGLNLNTNYGFTGGPLWTLIGSPDDDFISVDQDKQVNCADCIHTNYDDNFEVTLLPDKFKTDDIFMDKPVDHSSSYPFEAHARLVLPFPEREGVTYDDADPRAASVLCVDTAFSTNYILFHMYGKRPNNSNRNDSSFLPLVTFYLSAIVPDAWNHVFFSVDLDPMVIGGGVQAEDNGFNGGGAVSPYILTPPNAVFRINGSGGGSLADPHLPVWQPYGAGTFKMHIENGHVGLPVVPSEVDRYKSAGKNQLIRYAYTQIWFDKNVDPDAKFFDPIDKVERPNLDAFMRMKDGKPIPPPRKQLFLAQELFGKSDVYLIMDKRKGSQKAKYDWLQNQGSGGIFSVTGTKPKDYHPGPGQKKKEGVSNP